MDYVISLFIFIGSYLIGSLSFARIFLFFKKTNKKIEDLEINIKNSEDNSKNVFGAGAGSASMILGTKYGIIIGILDILKALVPIFLILHFYFPNEYYHLIFSLGVLIGHNWPIYFRFKGGRGISVIFGGFLAIDLFGAGVTTILGLLFGMIVVGYPLLGYSGWLWLMVPWLFLRTFDWVFLVYSILVLLIFLIATIPEIRAFLIHKKENNLKQYNEEKMNSSAQWRSIQKIQDFIDKLGFFKYPAKLIVLIIIVYIFYLFSKFNS